MNPRRIPRIARLVALAVAPVVLCVPLAAYAGLNDVPDPLYSSSTNPSGTDSAATIDNWYRLGWGSSLYPEFKLGLPAVTVPEFLLGTLYMVDKSPTTVVNTAIPGDYYRSAMPVGMHLDQTVDVLGTAGMLGQPVEGQWYLHYKFHSSVGYATTQLHIPFGVDITPPQPVSGLQVRPGIGLTPLGATDWVSSSRAHLTWTTGPYDALSGDAYYQVFIDGTAVIPDSVTNPTQGRVYAATAGGSALPTAITIENVPPGSHTLGIVVVDRAENSSEVTSVVFNSDPDTPTISLEVPTILTSMAQMIATVGDKGGVAKVDFYVDGTLVGAKTAAPYVLDTPVTAGAHVFSATVTDMFGRTATAFAGGSATPGSGFKTFIWAALNGVEYREPGGVSPLRYFNTRVVDASFTASSSVDAFAYKLSRSDVDMPGLPSVTTTPPTATASTGGTSSSVNVRLTLADWASVQSSPATAPAGGTIIDPLEGIWYVSAKGLLWSESPPLSSSYRQVRFCIDLTPPRVPTGLRPVTGTPSGWLSSGRVDVQWNNPSTAGYVAYDQMSGDKHYLVWVNGVLEPSPVMVPLGQAFTTYSIETLQTGVNTVEVAVVDTAGNTGPKASLAIMVDPDAPTVVNTTGAYLGRYAALSCVANDGAGVSRVVWSVDGVPVATSYAAPYGATVDMAGFGLGAHVVTATVYDMAGRSASSWVVSTVLDLTVPTVYSVSSSPTPFYPIKHDRYRDTTRISYRLASAGYVTLEIFDAAGNLVRSMAGWRGAGLNSFVWDGHRADGTIVPGGYSYRITANDGQYNISQAWGSTEIRSYYLKRISRRRVRVVFS